MVLAVDLGTQPTQTINSSTQNGEDVALSLGSSGTLIFDGVTSQISSIAGIGVASNTTIEAINGANVTINSGLANVGAGSAFNLQIGAGSQLNIEQPAVGVGLGASTAVNFLSTGGTGIFTYTPNLLNVSLGSIPTITGLSAGDQIDVTGATGASLSGGVLTFNYPGALGIGSNTVSFNVTGLPPTTSVTFNAATGAAVFACFLRGTRVATPSGEVPIEDLRVGDEVLALKQGRAAIKWIGRRVLDPSAIHPPSAGLPVRVCRNAVAENVPHRDLYLSPDHSLLLDDVLIPVKLLINGHTIVQERRTDAFEYFHIELHTHDVIVVEGAPAETYMDMGNRHMFGAPGTILLHVDAKQGDWSQYCFPPAYEGEIFDGVVDRLARRARLLGFEPELALAS